MVLHILGSCAGADPESFQVCVGGSKIRLLLICLSHHILHTREGIRTNILSGPIMASGDG